MCSVMAMKQVLQNACMVVGGNMAASTLMTLALTVGKMVRCISCVITIDDICELWFIHCCKYSPI